MGRSGMHGRRWTSAGGAAVLAGVLATAGCSGGLFGGGSDATLPGASASADPAVTTPPPGAEKLAKFYSQQLTWEDCQQAKCSWLQVPVDYDKPEGDTVKLRLLKVPARGTAKGALLVNPGGPGGSATEYAAAANFIVSAKMRQTYDVVGLDPRGVGMSNPISCLDDPAMDTMMGADPTPDTPAEKADVEKIAKDFGAACQQKYPALLPHVSTVEAAKDMDIARAALGQAKLTYLGKSYGTYLGAIYADTFPTHVGRVVLDGAMAPDLTDEQLSLGQAKGFETATRAYAADCVKKGGCPLGNDLDGAMKSLQDLIKRLDSSPLPVKGDARVKSLTEGWASMGMAAVMYSEDRWPELTRALRSAKNGDGTELFALGADYVDRKNGHYEDNMMQVISAVNCLDHPVERLTDAQEASQLEEFTKAAPTWGPYMAGSSYTCLDWPVKPTATPHKVTADGADPIMVVGTTRDPATPYEWAQQLAGQLKSARLVTWDGDGHTAYMRSNRCVTDAVDNYFIDGKVPDGETKC